MKKSLVSSIVAAVLLALTGCGGGGGVQFDTGGTSVQVGGVFQTSPPASSWDYGSMGSRSGVSTHRFNPAGAPAGALVIAGMPTSVNAMRIADNVSAMRGLLAETRANLNSPADVVYAPDVDAEVLTQANSAYLSELITKGDGSWLLTHHLVALALPGPGCTDTGTFLAVAGNGAQTCLSAQFNGYNPLMSHLFGANGFTLVDPIVASFSASVKHVPVQFQRGEAVTWKTVTAMNVRTIDPTRDNRGELIISVGNTVIPFSVAGRDDSLCQVGAINCPVHAPNIFVRLPAEADQGFGVRVKFVSGATEVPVNIAYAQKGDLRNIKLTPTSLAKGLTYTMRIQYKMGGSVYEVRTGYTAGDPIWN